MLSKIQVVENSDRFHVCENGIPEATFMANLYISREVANLSANSYALKLAIERQQDDFEVKLLPQEKK